MEKKINIAELLKDCPNGMELDCTVFENLEFDLINKDNGAYPIICRVKTKWGYYNAHTFTEYGCCSTEKYSKCVIFPKGKTTWEGFVPPCKFKDGDIIFTHANCLKVGLGNTWISIFQEKRNGGIATYVDCAEDGSDYYSNIDGDKAFLCFEKDILRQRFATEEEKQKLFDAIKANGYKWNKETKTLEKLIKPKFKVGDRIQSIRVNLGNIYNVIEVEESSYVVNKHNENINFHIDFELQDDWELVPNKGIPNKFDITTLKPFDKVLVRDGNDEVWVNAFFGFRDTVTYKTCTFITGNENWCQCIPYEGNEHLLGTTDDCDEYFKIW